MRKLSHFVPQTTRVPGLGRPSPLEPGCYFNCIDKIPTLTEGPSVGFSVGSVNGPAPVPGST